MKKVFEVMLIIFTGLFLVGLFSLLFQIVGEDSPNKATIISGILSMIGGGIGALSAFLIAKMQLTKQLELQDKKNREMFLAEMKIKKAEEILNILFESRMAYFSLKGAWDSYVMDCNGVSEENINKKFDKNELKNSELIDIFSMKRDEFILTYSKIYSYRPFFTELIMDIIDDQEKYFKPLTSEANEITFISLGLGIGNQFDKYIDFRKKWIPRVLEIENKFDYVIDLIHKQALTFEEEINKIIIEFKGK